MTTKAILAILPALAMTAVPCANAALINVNFHDDAGGETESQLDGPLGGANSTWNQSATTSGTNVLDSGGGATAVDWSYSPGSINENDTFSWPNPTRVMLIGSFAQFGKGSDATLTISDLTPGALYNVAIASTRLRTIGTEHSHGTFSTSNNTTSASSQLVDGLTSIDGDAWDKGENYALFENVEADGSGVITFLANASSAAELSDVEGRRLHINGFQIEQVPEPSTTALLGLGGLALVLRRRK